VTALTLLLLTLAAGKVVKSCWRSFTLSDTAKARAQKHYIESKEISEEAVLPRGQEYDEKKYVWHMTAMSCIGTPFWLFLGPFALHIALHFELNYSYHDPLNFQNDISIMNEDELRVHNMGTLAGEMYLGYLIYKIVMFRHGWDRGADIIMHHVLFMLLALIQVSYSVLIRVGMWALAMELSTPFFHLMQVATQIKGPTAEASQSVLYYLYVGLFVVFRILGFGYAFLTLLFVVLTDYHTVFPSATEKFDALPETRCIILLLLLFCGWCWQISWVKRKFLKKEDQPAGEGEKADEEGVTQPLIDTEQRKHGTVD